MQTKSDREILLSLLWGLTLCDHMGDASNDMADAVRDLGIKVEGGDDWFANLRKQIELLQQKGGVGKSSHK